MSKADKIFFTCSTGILGGVATFLTGATLDYFFETGGYVTTSLATAGAIVGGWVGNKYAQSIDPHQFTDPVRIAEQYLQNEGVTSLSHRADGQGEYSIYTVGNSKLYQKLDLVLALANSKGKENGIPEFTTEFNFFELSPKNKNAYAGTSWENYLRTHDLGEICETSTTFIDLDRAITKCVDPDAQNVVRDYFRINFSFSTNAHYANGPINMNAAIDGFLNFKEDLHYSFEKKIPNTVKSDLEQF